MFNLKKNIFDDFKKRLYTTKSDTVAYGMDEIQHALEYAAIKFLLTTKQKKDSIITNVMEQGGEVLRYTPTNHCEAYGFINDIGGYCAVLRFSLPEQYQSGDESVVEEEKDEKPTVPLREVEKPHITMTQLLVNAPRSGRINPFANASKVNPFST